MTFDEFLILIERLKSIGKDTQLCEVKSAVQKLPVSLVETLSAFANGAGGVVILGLSEDAGFRPAAGFKAAETQDALISAGEKLTPVVRPETEIFAFEGAKVLVATIRPMSAEEKPCFVTARGKYSGSYIRTGDGDRKLNKYEIDRMMEANRQPCWDAEVINDATRHDLDEAMLSALITRQRFLHPRIFNNFSEEEVLVNMRVLAENGGELHPTLAGLLALGKYPQKYFPSLVVTFTLFPEEKGSGMRFLDSKRLVGPMPAMIADTVELVSRNMRTGAVIEGAFRKELPDYPAVAVREAVANALQHRDYSPEGRSSPVAVNMYPDRLEIINPGGLYGRMTLEDLGKPGITATRNQFLSSILETTPYPGEGFVVENRGSGIRAIASSLEGARMFPAEMLSTLNNFQIAFLKRRRLPEEKTSIAGSELEKAILAELETHSSLSLKELIDFSGLSRSTVSGRIRKLVA
ncbi:MAG: putative DNA binding domain-containing protein, partial [Mailhella sp.]|nr:putative DNA binding domain-containing protein [Mailhella sp.]